MIESITETVLALQAELTELGLVLKKAKRKQLPDLEAAEGLVALTKMYGNLRKVAARLKLAASNGKEGPGLFDGGQA